MVEKKDLTVKIQSNFDDALAIAKALSSKTRMQIIGIIQNGGTMNVSEIAERLRQTEANISAQIKILEKARIVVPEYAPGKHGVQKNVKLAINMLTFNFQDLENNENNTTT